MAEKNADSVNSSRNIVKALLFIFSAASSTYLVSLKGEWIWFSWHPVSMIFAFIFLSGFAILTKKSGGYVNTKIHGLVIYTNKESFGKPHLVTLHAKIGVIVLIAYIALSCFSFPALNPDWGFLKTNKVVR
jgi:hypothetical protein